VSGPNPQKTGGPTYFGVSTNITRIVENWLDQVGPVGPILGLSETHSLSPQAKGLGRLDR
jgi:hypothetical protein